MKELKEHLIRSIVDESIYVDEIDELQKRIDKDLKKEYAVMSVMLLNSYESRDPEKTSEARLAYEEFLNAHKDNEDLLDYIIKRAEHALKLPTIKNHPKSYHFRWHTDKCAIAKKVKNS